MHSIQRKTISDDARSILLRAAREQQGLVWDRLEDMQPQCGFGRLALSCTDCLEGPCRINPFAEVEQETVCGRSRTDLVAAYFLKNVNNGTIALANLADASFPGDDPAGAKPDLEEAAPVLMPSDSLPEAAELNFRLEAMAPFIREALGTLSGKPYEAVAGMGCLDEKTANIALHGFVPPFSVGLLQKAAARQSSVTLCGICGTEGSKGIASIATYGSQELPLLSGKIDAVIVGEQCVSPAFKRLAKERGIALAPAAFITDEVRAGEIVDKALAGLKARSAKAAPDTGKPVDFTGGYTFASCPQLPEALARGVKEGKIAGLAFIGGCGNIKHTQDADLITLAAALLADGYLVASAGCVATAFARNGLCSAQAPMPESLRAALPQGTPPVLHLGPCSAAGTFITMAETCAAANIPTLAVIAEPVHGKASAIAVAIAAGGVPTYFDSELFPWLPDSLLQGKLLPLSSLSQSRSVSKASS